MRLIAIEYESEFLSLVGRYYDPYIDQFMSVDPLVETTGQPYAFTGDDPLNETDPLGLSGRTSNKTYRERKASLERALEAELEKIRTAEEKGNQNALKHWNDIPRGIQRQLDNVNRRLSLTQATPQNLVTVTPSAELGPAQIPQYSTTQELNAMNDASTQFQYPALQAPPLGALGVLGTVLLGGAVVALSPLGE